METISRRSAIGYTAALALGTGAVGGLTTRKAMAEGADCDFAADIVVIGGGGAGLTAAAAAAAEGSSVIILEKSRECGGDSLLARVFFGYWPEKRLADGWGEDSAEAFMEEYKGTHDYMSIKGRAGEPLPDKLPFLEKYSEIFAPAADFLESLGVEFVARYPRETTAELIPISNDPAGPGPCALGNTGRSWVTSSVWPPIVEEHLKTLDTVEILRDCAATKIVKEDGRATVVEFIDTDGTPRTARASKGILIATGMFGANPGMVDKYLGYNHSRFGQSYCKNVTGDGIVLALGAGAALNGMDLPPEYVSLFDGSFNGISYFDSFGKFEGARGENIPGIVIGGEGRRFMAESRGNTEIARDTAMRDDGVGYYVCDSLCDTTWLEGIRDVQWADTIEDLASAMGVDAEALVDEVSRYNGFVEQGVDEDFGKRMGGTNKLENAPFYAARIQPHIHVTLGGIKTDPDARVLDPDGTVIPGLYAAGVSTGSYWEQEGLGYTGGVNQCMAWGYLAGINLANEA